ncbi:MAG: copper-binding protein [Planctomycetia bacterium]|jgi:Cu/Ag efflux protein CusF|nr:copper-binding protein [Planctomycetia bacterium]
MRSITQLACTALLITFVVGCQNAGKVTPSSTDKVYDLRGTIMSIDKEKNMVMLDHEDIPGLMRAMKMSFPVEDAKLLTNLKEGDKVQGMIKARADGKNIISDLQKRSDP